MSRGYSYVMGDDSDMKGADSDVKRGLPHVAPRRR